MMVRSIVTALVLTLGLSAAYAGDLRTPARQAPMAIDDGVVRQAAPRPDGYIPGNDNPVSLTWVTVDSMANAFGPASTRARMMSYDPGTNILAVIHRGGPPYGVSGGLWYNISRDGGLTWRRPGDLNGGIPLTNRYPAGAIVNPTGSADTNNAFFVYVAPNLENAGTWGYYTIGVDYPLGGGAGSGAVDPNLMGDNSAAANIMGTAGNSPSIVWAATMGTTTGGDNNSRAWRTEDWITISTQIPPTWTEGAPNFLNAISFVPGMANSTGHYFGMHGLFYPDSLAYSYNIGYSRSTDGGATWGQWVRPQPDWMIATGLPPRYDIYDYVQPAGGTVSWNGEMVIDNLGRGHFFHVVVDTPWTQHDPRGVIEIAQTASGWEYKWVTPVGTINTYTAIGYPGVANGYLQQTNQGLRAAISPDGTVMALVWLNAGSMTPADSMSDIWFSYRALSSGTWSTPVNLTQTPSFPELLLHVAPTLKHNGGNSYTLFLGRSYQSGLNTYPPDNGLQTTIYVAAHTFTTTSAPEEGQPIEFKLSQNYPNPFNPKTNIEYSVNTAGPLSIKVYNMLGQEVATIVDRHHDAGRHEVVFDASSLASGVYVYRMVAGNFVESRKMVLVK